MPAGRRRLLYPIRRSKEALINAVLSETCLASGDVVSHILCH